MSEHNAADLAAIEAAIQEGFLAPYEEPLTPTRDRIIEALRRRGFVIARSASPSDTRSVDGLREECRIAGEHDHHHRFDGPHYLCAVLSTLPTEDAPE